MAWAVNTRFEIARSRFAVTNPPLTSWRRIYRATRSLSDRVTHRRRHLLAIKRIVTVGRPRRILVVCQGNICRSPYLEAVLRREIRDAIVTSAGFIGRGRPVPSHALMVALERGIDLSAFRSQSVSMEKVRAADLILVMDVWQARQIVRGFGGSASRILIAGDLDPVESTRTVRDPWNGSRERFEAAFTRLDRCAATLVAALASAK